MDVRMPDGTILRGVPEGTPKDVIMARYQSRTQATQQPEGQQSGVGRLATAMGAIGRVGAAMFPGVAAVGETAVGLGSSAIAAPASGVVGAASLPAGMDRAVQNIDRVSGAMSYQPRTTGGQALSALGSYLPSQIGRGAHVAGGKVAEVTGSPAAGAAVNTALQAAPALLLSKGVVRPSGMGRSAAPGASAPKPTAPAAQAGRQPGLARVPAAPSKEALKAASTAAYKRAEAAGAVIKPESFSKAVDVITRKLEREGLDPQLHPDTTAALKRLKGESGPVSFEKLDTLRRIASSARKSQKPDDARLAGEIVDTLDRYADTVGRQDLVSGSPRAAKAYREARNLYSRSRKAQTLDELIERAELTASNFTGSGMENAVRTEFRSLAKNQKRMRLFTAEEQAAIRKVAKGGPVENTLRMLGKFAPTGVVSAGLSAGAGLVAGGPIGAVALPVAGAASRLAATRITLKNADRANELVRRGPQQSNATAKKRSSFMSQ